MEPAAFTTAFAGLEPSLEKLRDYARDRLKAELAELRPVLIEERVKTRSTAYEKLQTGEYTSLLALEDLVGLKIVVLHRRDIEPAVEVVRSSFQVEREKKRVVDPSTFRYRERHLIIRPPRAYLDRNPDVAELRVELQLTSAVQYALDQATHDFDYKGQTLEWARFRLVAQLRATLELVDNTLDSMDQAAEQIEQSVDLPEELKRQNVVLSVINASFEDEVLPSDRRRLAATADRLLAAAGLPVEEFADLLTRHKDLVEARSINPIDAILGVVLREGRDPLVANFTGRLAVSDELLSLCDEASRVPQDRQVILGSGT